MCLKVLVYQIQSIQSNKISKNLYQIQPIQNMEFQFKFLQIVFRLILIDFLIEKEIAKSTKRVDFMKIKSC